MFRPVSTDVRSVGTVVLAAVPGLVGVVSTAVTTVAVSVTSVVAVASSVRVPSSIAVPVTPAISVRLAIGNGSHGRIAVAVVVRIKFRNVEEWRDIVVIIIVVVAIVVLLVTIPIAVSLSRPPVSMTVDPRTVVLCQVHSQVYLSPPRILDLRLQQMLSMRCGVEEMVEQSIVVGRAAEAAVGAEAAGEEARWTR